MGSDCRHLSLSTRTELHELENPGQTDADLLQELARQRRRDDLEARLQNLEGAAEVRALESLPIDDAHKRCGC